ncbi:hypothetical protein HNE_1438 [Hyphomonas neptunium ATCC 15444]|uniref:Uncharacterized protein n=1 Tax=Hyphomonas neptunium (strain ATCC 15444) TaxID=228405 RepID=Q0C289_HYPNA|nr:hypothetical protein HNE_1438 [Hyphomonas neptunium ATCC 15444]
MSFADFVEEGFKRRIDAIDELRIILSRLGVPHACYPFIHGRRAFAHDLRRRRVLAKMAEHGGHHSEICNRRGVAEQEGTSDKDLLHKVQRRQIGPVRVIAGLLIYTITAYETAPLAALETVQSEKARKGQHAADQLLIEKFRRMLTVAAIGPAIVHRRPPEPFIAIVLDEKRDEIKGRIGGIDGRLVLLALQPGDHRCGVGHPAPVSDPDHGHLNDPHALNQLPAVGDRRQGCVRDRAVAQIGLELAGIVGDLAPIDLHDTGRVICLAHTNAPLQSCRTRRSASSTRSAEQRRGIKRRLMAARAFEVSLPGLSRFKPLWQFDVTGRNGPVPVDETLRSLCLLLHT